MKEFNPTKYTLECVATGREFEDSGWAMEDRESKSTSLVRAKYEKQQITVGGDDMGLYKFADWLPVNRMLNGSSAPVTYKSKGLAEHLGLENLYITFSGYNPAVGATMPTCSFKETEAYSVCARAKEDEERVLVVASAGNTARAFAKVCSDNDIKLLLSVPADNLDALWFDAPIKPCVKLIACEKGGDYFDAIHLSNLALKSRLFYAEGGAKNVARRDGMATTMLSATTTIGEIPDYYFQAVGSGTGAIAAWEANLRLIEDGRFGNKTMKLMVSQNAPFVPMYNAWRVDSREMLPYDDDKARRDVEIIDAKVLSNRKPPYGIIGGLYDALKATDGEVLVATNAQSRKAKELFKELEGVDIYSASGVATATLIKAVKDGKIEKNAVVMLNITGGGEELFKSKHECVKLEPSIIFPLSAEEEDIVEKCEALFGVVREKPTEEIAEPEQPYERKWSAR
ncbi:MAG: cysteate synthase [Rikenellaceae bacterium]